MRPSAYMEGRESLFDFMPYGAPELKEVAQKYMFRGVLFGSAAFMLVFLLSFGTSAFVVRPLNLMPFRFSALWVRPLGDSALEVRPLGDSALWDRAACAVPVAQTAVRSRAWIERFIAVSFGSVRWGFGVRAHVGTRRHMVSTRPSQRG